MEIHSIDIALWLSAIVFTIGVAMIIYAWQIKTQNDDLKKKMSN